MKLKYYLRGLGIGIALTAVILHFSVYNSDSVLTDEEIMERAGRLGMVHHVTLSENESMMNEGEVPTVDIEDGPVITDIPNASDDGQGTDGQDELSDPDESGEAPSDENPSGEDISDEDNSGENTSNGNISGGNTANENTPGRYPSGVDVSSINPAEEDYVPNNGQSEDNNIVGSEEQSEGMGGTEDMGDSIVITVTGGDSSVSVASKLAQAGLVSSAAAYDNYLCDNGYDKRISTGVHVIPIGASEREIAEIITTRQ